MNSNKKFNLILFETINLVLSLVLFLSSFFILKQTKLMYGGGAFLLASILSILFVNLTPFIFEKIERNILQIHIFISIMLGTTLNFYAYINEFDFYLHILLGIVASVISIPILKYFLSKSNLSISKLSISLIIFIIFCFAESAGAIWEIYEFTVDQLFNLNTQNGSLLDTMTDIIANTIGSISFCIYYYLKNKKQAK